MKIAGEATLNAPVDKVWAAILDPQVLVATIPGCERLEATGPHAYEMTVTAGVASIKGTYAGTCALSDLVEHQSLVLSASGAGSPGTISTDVQVRLTPAGDDATTISYDADATVGGMIAGVGQRMLSSVSKRMAAEFFGNVDRVIADGVPSAAESGVIPTPTAVRGGAVQQAGLGQVFTAPGASTTTGDPGFLKGVAVGAGLVLLGVAAGALATRSR